MKNHLKILSIGAGAIGTYIGGSLAIQGHKVVFLERPQIVQELRTKGLRLTIGNTVHQITEPEFANSIQEALNQSRFDVVLFALKSYDTPTFIQSIDSLPEEIPPFLCLSNGVDNEPALMRVLGPEKVIAGTVTSAIGRRGAGDIILERLRGVGVAGGHSLSKRLVTALNDSGLNARLYRSSADMKWSKMLTNLISNATSAILDMPPAEIFSHPGLYRLEITQLRESLTVMSAQRIKLVDLPGTPVRLLGLAVRTLPLLVSQPILSKAVGGGRGGKMPSFHIDLHSVGGKSEVDYLNGAVVRVGKQKGIPTPANELLNRVLLELTNGNISINEFRNQPEKLLTEFDYLKRETFKA